MLVNRLFGRKLRYAFWNLEFGLWPKTALCNRERRKFVVMVEGQCATRIALCDHEGASPQMVLKVRAGYEFFSFWKPPVQARLE
jgi:hypothetical protein